ncbi:TPR-like protein [Ascodesmis nigricans]|uniref:TPR-like protein n=1 Tax=Ascodesmis nigricans TaxID=341454 RepID=A0A4S2MVW1_9PEZI|nr:TPR-like protein [Ascodesmis nigricans]
MPKRRPLKPDWAKGWSRVGAAQHGLGDLVASVEAYEEALKLDPANAQAKAGHKAVKDAIDRERQEDGANAGDWDFGKMFSDPGFVTKLATNPKTSALLADPEFMAKLERVKQNPNLLQEELRDPRMMQVLAVLLGIQIETAPGAGGAGQEDTPMPDAPAPEPKKEAEPEPVPEPENDDEKAKKEAKAAADKEKEIGTQNYKQRNFDAAIEHYSKAWELHKDITYLNNIAAAKFEAGDLDGCIKECEKAVEEGRDMRADFKLIAKALGRIGTAYVKKNDLEQAITYFQRSLTEHRTPDILSKLRAAEKTKIENEKLAYIDPAKAEEAREEGNKLFKSADFAGAVKAYTEAIKRAPEDPRGYTNRAAALQKLMSLPEAVKDCDEAIKKDPAFMRAYTRKAQLYLAMREFSKCLDACNEATEADKEHKHTREIEDLTRKCLQQMYSAREGETEEETMARIQRDPEIVSIIGDPVMQSILQQAKQNPQALNEHMKNPMIRQKIQKLMAAGIIRVG